MNLITRDIPNDDYLWWVFGSGQTLGFWGHYQAGGSFFSSQWLTVSHRPEAAPNQVALIDLGGNENTVDPRSSDRVTFDVSGQHSMLLRNVEYVDASLDKSVEINWIEHFGTTTDGSIDRINANIGNHEFHFTTAVKDSSLHLGAGWDTVNLIDHRDIPGTQYWSLIRRGDNALDAYSLLTGNRIRMEDGVESRNGVQGYHNFGEVEQLFLKNATNNQTVEYKPGVDIRAGGTRANFENIDLRSDGTPFSNSFNLAYFNFIRYTSDNVWVGEATIHDGTIYSTPSDRTVTAAKYGVNAPVIEGQLSVIGQSRNGTHDLIVEQQGTAIDGMLRLYAFDVDSGMYNQFNSVYLGDAVGRSVDMSSKGAGIADRVALYGFGGNDVLIGGSGRDYIFGGQSEYNQLLNAAGLGNQVTGGAGADFFGVGNTNAAGAVTGSTTVLGSGVGDFHQGYATDVIMDWRAQTSTSPHNEADTLFVLSNGVAVIAGLRDGDGTVSLSGNNLIDLRSYSAVATSDQNGTGARGGDGWDATESLQFIFDNQTARDNGSIANEGDLTVVNKGLIVAKGGTGNDTIFGSDGKDYLYGNSGSNVIIINNANDGDALASGDRVYFDTRSGKQYVADFTVGTDKFFVAKDVIDAFTNNAARSFTPINAATSTPGGTFIRYTQGEAYDQNVTFIHSPIYKAMLNGIYGPGPYTNEQYYRTDFFADQGTTAAGKVSTGIAKGLLGIPFVGPALAAPFFVLGALFKSAQSFSNDWDPLELIPANPILNVSTDYSSITGSQQKGVPILGSVSHLNAVYQASADFSASYVYTLQTTSNLKNTNTTLATATSTGADNLKFLDFFEGAYTNDGFIPVLELNPGLAGPVYGYFAVHSANETFVYLVISEDNLIENGEAILVAEIEGRLTSADFAVYDSSQDIYNAGSDTAVVLVTPQIIGVNDGNGTSIANGARTFDDDAIVRVSITGEVTPGTVVKIYDSNDVDPATNAPRLVGQTTVGGTNPIVDIPDTRKVGQSLIQTDYDVPTPDNNGEFPALGNSTGNLRPIDQDNTFEYVDQRIFYYAVVENDIGDGIVLERRSNAWEIRASGLSDASLDGGAGFDTLFLSATSAHLNTVADNKLINVEAIRVKDPLPPILSVVVNADGTITGINILEPGSDLANGEYSLTFTNGSGAAGSGAVGWKAVVSGGRVTSIVTGSSGGTGYDLDDEVSASWGMLPVLIDLRNQTDGFDIFASSGNDTIYGSLFADTVNNGNDIINGGAGADYIDAGSGDDIIVYNSQAGLVEDVTVIGGTGTDTLRFDTGIDALQLISSDFTKVTQMEVLALNGTGTQQVTLGSQTNTAFLTGITVTTLATATSLNLQAALSSITVHATGTNNADTLIGGSANDTLIGGEGDDTIEGKAGVDSLVGGEGNDTFVYDSSVADATGVGETIDGGNGTDRIVVAGGTQSINFSDDTITSIEILELTVNAVGVADADDQSLTMTNAQIDGLSTINANGGDNITISNTMLSNMLDGTTVNGTLELKLTDQSAATVVAQALTLVDGTLGNSDLLKVNASALTSDTLTFNGSAETTARVSVTGGAGADSIVGGGGNDTIITGDGSDTIAAGAGADDIRLSGGEGNDVVSYLPDDGAGAGGSSGWDTLSGFDGTKIGASTMDRIEIAGFADRSENTSINTIDYLGFDGTSAVPATDENLGYASSEMNNDAGVVDETELLIVTDSTVSSLADVSTALESAYDLSTLASGTVIFSVKGNGTNDWWVGLYDHDASTYSNGDNLTADLEILTVVTTETGTVFGPDNFWQPGILLNVPEVYAAAVLGENGGVRLVSDQTGAIKLGGDFVNTDGTTSSQITGLDYDLPLTFAGSTFISEQSTAAEGRLSVTNSDGVPGFLRNWDGSDPANLNTVLSASPNTVGTTYGLGTTGNDSLSADYVWGYGGDDLLDGVYVWGGAGNDTIVGSETDVTLDGGAGTDLLRIGDNFADISNAQIVDIELIELTADALTVSLDDQTEAFEITAFAAGSSTITMGSGNDTIIAGSGNDSIVTGNGDNEVRFAIENLDADDDVTGGSGTDQITLTTAGTLEDEDLTNVTSVERLRLADSAANSITLDAEAQDAGILTVIGGTNDDAIDASGYTVGIDISGGLGNDTISAGSGNDTISTGDGDNEVRFAIDNLDINDSVAGGSGTDQITLTTAGTLIDSDLTNVSSVETLKLADGAASTVTLSGQAQGAGIRTVVAGDDDDVVDASLYTVGIDISGGLGNDTISAGSGNDTISTGDGVNEVRFAIDNLDINDSVTGGSEVDTIKLMTAGSLSDADFTNFSGVDRLVLADGSNNITLSGEARHAGIQTVLGGTGNDVVDANLYNSALNISIDGGDGNDTLTGGAGVDTLIGGDGNDVFVYETIERLFAVASNALEDTIDGSGGTDTIRIDETDTYSIEVADSWARATNVEVLAAGAANSGNISIILNEDAFDTAGIRTVTLAADSNVGGSNTIDASAADNGQNLTLIGSSGVDTIIGGEGNDSISGGGGNDNLTGGLGVDTFNVTAGTDTITDLGKDGADVLIVGSGFSARAEATVDEAWTATSETKNLKTYTSAIITTSGLAVDVSVATASTGGSTGGFTITNTGAATTLTGSSAHDSITGGSGNDTIDASSGADTIEAGEGEDHVDVGSDAQADLVIVNAVASTSSDSNRVIVSGDGNDLGEDRITNFNFTNDTIRVVASNINVFNHQNNTHMGTALAVNDGSVGSFDTSTGLVNLSGADGGTIAAGDIAMTFTEATPPSEADFQSRLQYVLTGTNNADTIYAGSLDDTITGGGGSDSLFGSGGNDVFRFGNGEFIAGDSVDGGTGTDTILLTADGQTIAETDFANKLNLEKLTTADGTNIIRIDNTAAAAFSNVTVTITGGDGNDTLNIDGAGRDVSILAGEGDDVITGSAQSSTIEGGEGDDIINLSAGSANKVTDAANGDDTVNVTGGTSTVEVTGTDKITLIASAGDTIVNLNNSTAVNDIRASATANVTVNGTSGNDRIDATNSTTGVEINGFDGNNTLLGGSGNDTLQGDSGNDTLAGGAGDNTLTGGTGADVFVIDSSGTAFVTDFAIGSDVISFSGDLGALDFSSAVVADKEKAAQFTPVISGGNGNTVKFVVGSLFDDGPFTITSLFTVTQTVRNDGLGKTYSRTSSINSETVITGKSDFESNIEQSGKFPTSISGNTITMTTPGGNTWPESITDGTERYSAATNLNVLMRNVEDFDLGDDNLGLIASTEHSLSATDIENVSLVQDVLDYNHNNANGLYDFSSTTDNGEFNRSLFAISSSDNQKTAIWEHTQSSTGDNTVEVGELELLAVLDIIGGSFSTTDILDTWTL